MRKFILNKLVPTGVIASMEEAGTIIESQSLTTDETYIATLHKIIEEAQEAIQAPKEKRGTELAQLRLVMKAAEATSGVPLNEINDAEIEQREKKGRFVPGVFVVSVAVHDDDPMAEYYASDPDRFPEVTPEVD